MPLPRLLLRASNTAQGFLPGPPGVQTALRIPAFAWGDLVPVRLVCYEESATGAISAYDASGFYLELSLGNNNERPTQGLFTITLDGATSGPIPAGASPAEVQEIINSAPRILSIDATVSGAAGDLVVRFNAITGVLAAPTVAFSGAVTASAVVTVISAGSSTVPAEWRINLVESAPARIGPNDWTPDNTTASMTVDSLGNNQWRVQPDPRAEAGFYVISIGGQAARPLSLNAPAWEIQTAIQLLSAGTGAQVMSDPRGGVVISLLNNSAVTASGAGLIIPPALLGTLDLSGAGVREILQGQQSCSTLLTLRVLDGLNGYIVTESATSVTLKMPVSRSLSTLVTIDKVASIFLPDMETGLWHEVSLTGTNAAPTLLIGSGAAWVDEQGPVFISDVDERGCYMLTISGGNAIRISAVRAQGLPVNASFMPRFLALESPEDEDLFCQLEITAPAAPAYEPASLQIGDPEP